MFFNLAWRNSKRNRSENLINQYNTSEIWYIAYTDIDTVCESNELTADGSSILHSEEDYLLLSYDIQNGDCWIKVYQVKMKNYKRVPIPITLYRLMQVYLKKLSQEKCELYVKSCKIY